MIKILAIPVICAAIATALFFAQGGFGGGHGDFDFAIGCLGLPALLWAERGWWNVPDFIQDNDLFAIIWMPAVINFFAVWLPIAVVYKLVRSKHLLGDQEKI